MARYQDVPENLKMTSEAIEPTFQYMLGRWFAQAEHMKTTYGQASMEHCDALENLWHGAKCLEDLAGLCIDTHHAVIASMNHVRFVARIVEKELGFDPILSPEDTPFRLYIKSNDD